MSSFGRKYSQEDNISIFTHGSFVGDFDQNFDRSRLEDAPTARDAYQTRVDELLAASWNELVAMYRTVRQIDAVKMVVIDLDDTLWRGVIADSELGDMPTSEGWPIGFWEALVILKRRGILLGIISKNEESRVREAWDGVLRGLMKLEDFAIFRINWGQKSQNLAEILKQVNILSRNVLYIDDNPAQRADIQASFPEIRVLGGAPYSWRHILLWAAEMQGVNITNESVRRTEMVQAQVKREEERQNVSPEQFLESLNIVIHSTIVRNTTDGKFKRAFELINKTNQFNTTGKRWTQDECAAAFTENVEFWVYEVTDRFTDYGLVAVLVLREESIAQFVMSCRVMGLDVEIAALAHATERLRSKGKQAITAAMVHTDRNLPCQNIYDQCGFKPDGVGWRLPVPSTLIVPSHIRFEA